MNRNDLLDLHYPAPPIYPTVQCGINLTVQLFVACGLLWIFITRKQSKAETPGSNTVKNAMEAAWGCSSARGSRSSFGPDAPAPPSTKAVGMAGMMQLHFEIGCYA